MTLRGLVDCLALNGMLALQAPIVAVTRSGMAEMLDLFLDNIVGRCMYLVDFHVYQIPDRCLLPEATFGMIVKVKYQCEAFVTETVFLTLGASATILVKLTELIPIRRPAQYVLSEQK